MIKNMTTPSVSRQGIRPRFRFRAHRRYVHSTDIYTVLLDVLSETFPGAAPGPLQISFHKRVGQQMAIHFGVFSKTEHQARSPIDFFTVIGGEEVQGWFEELNEDVTLIEPYDETAIRVRSVVGDGSVALYEPCEAAPIEVLTSLTTHLHETCFPAAAGTKWLLARLDLRHPLSDEDAVDICIRNTKFIGRRVSRSEIICHGTKTGEIIFSTGEK
jgi:hypothetical protein